VRVALVHPFSWPEVRRGGERYLHDLAWYLTGQGHEVDVIVGGAPGIEQGPDGRLVRLRHPSRLQVRGLTATDTFGLPALAWLARHRYDVVHALTPTAALAAVATRQRVAYTALGHPTRRSISVRRHDLKMFRTTMHRVAAPLALSQSAAESITELVGVRAQVVPPGLRTAMFPLDDRPRTGPARILFPAHASDQRKGLDVLLQSFAQVLDRLPDARLVLGGGGDSRWAFDLLDSATRERVSAATDELGAGELGDVPARYAAATVTVLPSIEEAFGLVLVEALSTGTPVVGVASGGPIEIVDDASIGRLAPPKDAAGLADAICDVVELAGRPDTAARCAEHARRWDWDATIGPLHLSVYQRIARTHLA
jgi:phosphatidyl-myo-inositol alpha-mannosyltransferase